MFLDSILMLWVYYWYYNYSMAIWSTEYSDPLGYLFLTFGTLCQPVTVQASICIVFELHLHVTQSLSNPYTKHPLTLTGLLLEQQCLPVQ